MGVLPVLLGVVGPPGAGRFPRVLESSVSMACRLGAGAGRGVVAALSSGVMVVIGGSLGGAGSG